MGTANDAVGMIFAEKRSLHLEPAELAFIVAILATSRTSIVPELEDAAVEDLYVQVKTAFDSTAENPRRSATNAIASLRQQRLLARIDAAGMTAAGTFALTALGSAIAAAFLDQHEVLDKTNLSALGAALRTHLAQAVVRASHAGDDRAWLVVVQDLRTTGHELVGGISRRAAGLDSAQETIRDRVASLLESDWFGAVATCEELLDETARTLNELAEILLRDAGALLDLLQQIGAHAERSGAIEVVDAAADLARGIDRTTGWATHRQAAWSDYYQYVQRFLRDVVRLDPERALSQRLRDTLRAYPDRDWTFVCAKPTFVRMLRPLELLRATVPVSRERRPAAMLEVEPADVRPPTFEAEVRAALGHGATSLVDIVRALVAELAEDAHFGAVGRITAAVGREHGGSITRPHSGAWAEVGAIDMQDWELSSRADQANSERAEP